MWEGLMWQDPETVALEKLKRLRHQKGWDRGLDDEGAEMSKRLRWQDPEPVALGKLNRLRHQKGRDRPRLFRSRYVGKAEVARSRTSCLEEVEKAETSERARQRPRWFKSRDIGKAKVAKIIKVVFPIADNSAISETLCLFLKSSTNKAIFKYLLFSAFSSSPACTRPSSSTFHFWPFPQVQHEQGHLQVLVIFCLFLESSMYKAIFNYL